MPAEATQLPTYRPYHERLAWLEDISRELNSRFAGRAASAPNIGEKPPAYTLRLGDGRTFAKFGFVDANYFWTFDAETSVHYSRDRDVMRRLLVFELARALAEDNRS